MATNPPVRLIPRSAADGLAAFYELGDSTTLGRHPTNTICLGLDSVSRFHARIDKRGNFFIIQDLNSSNGTFVNGERITQITLHHNDEVTVGAVEFLFTNEATTQSTTSNQDGGGMSIVEFKEDSDSKPTTQSVIRPEQTKDKSSVFTALQNKQADKNTLMRLNNRLSTLYRLAELLKESEAEAESTTLTRVLELLFDAVPADRGTIMTRFAPGIGELEPAAIKYRDQPINPQRLSISRTILDQVLREKVAVLSQDTSADQRFGASESIIMNNIASAICVPMIQRGEVMGIIHLDSSSISRTFNADDLEFVTMIASEISVSLENARMRKEAAHRERLAAVGETVAGISHNVKNILLLMQGGSELLNRAFEKDDTETARESWAVVNRGIDKIGKLVRDMLEYSSNKRPRMTMVDINDLICSIAEEVEDQLVSKGVTLELNLEEELAPRLVDELGLQRTLLNLLVNSMEAIPHNEGNITITTALIPGGDGMLLVKVADNGSGIPKDKLERIWMPFFTTKGSSGTGLGLPMCKKVIEDMGGSITVESTLDEGTTFTMTIPLHESDSRESSDDTFNEDFH